MNLHDTATRQFCPQKGGGVSLHEPPLLQPPPPFPAWKFGGLGVLPASARLLIDPEDVPVGVNALQVEDDEDLLCEDVLVVSSPLSAVSSGKLASAWCCLIGKAHLCCPSQLRQTS